MFKKKRHPLSLEYFCHDLRPPKAQGGLQETILGLGTIPLKHYCRWPVLIGNVGKLLILRWHETKLQSTLRKMMTGKMVVDLVMFSPLAKHVILGMNHAILFQSMPISWNIHYKQSSSDMALAQTQYSTSVLEKANHNLFLGSSWDERIIKYCKFWAVWLHGIIIIR